MKNTARWAIAQEHQTETYYLVRLNFLGMSNWTSDITDVTPDNLFAPVTFTRRADAVAYARKHQVYPHRADVRIVKIPAR